MTLFSGKSAPISTAPVKDACPHLGIEEDPQTCLAYPSDWNLCHHVGVPSAIKLRYQRITCLSATHEVCPVFQNRAARLPAQLRGRRAQLKSGKTALLVIIIVLIVSFILWGAWWRLWTG